MTEYRYNQCPICGIHYAVDNVVMTFKQKCLSDSEDRGWYCPNGHYLVFMESDADKYRREAERLRQSLAQRDDEITDLGKRITAQKGQITKFKKRAAAGVCPCCHRTFENLHHHMATKHPDFSEEKAKIVPITSAKR